MLRPPCFTTPPPAVPGVSPRQPPSATRPARKYPHAATTPSRPRRLAVFQRAPSCGAPPATTLVLARFMPVFALCDTGHLRRSLPIPSRLPDVTANPSGSAARSHRLLPPESASARMRYRHARAAFRPVRTGWLAASQVAGPVLTGRDVPGASAESGDWTTPPLIGPKAAERAPRATKSRRLPPRPSSVRPRSRLSGSAVVQMETLPQSLHFSSMQAT